MAVLGVPIEALLASPAPSCSSRLCLSSQSPRNNNYRSAAPRGRISRPKYRGEVYGHAVLPSRSRDASNQSGNVDRPRLAISAIDAAQEFDYESMKLTEMKQKNCLKVGIVGFGNFGQFLAERFVQQGHHVLAHSRSDYGDLARQLGVTYYRFLTKSDSWPRDADDFCEEHPEVVVLCTSILSTESVLLSLPIQRLKRRTLFVDVLSVKEFPRSLFLQVLPTEFDVLCTHPMFGPESGRGSWQGLPFVFEKVRVRDGLRSERCRRFLNVFESEGCRMVEMSCKEHDRHAAGSQFITHTVGRVLGCVGLESTPLYSKDHKRLLRLNVFPSRVLGSLGLESTPINTKGYESLLKLVENTYSDSFDLYYGLFLYNVNATEEVGCRYSRLDLSETEELVRLERAFDVVKSQLFEKLHGILRDQMLKSSRLSEATVPTPPAPVLKALVAGPAQQKPEVSAAHSASSNNGAP